MATAVHGEEREVHVTLHGTAFCHQMVRSITGSLVEVGRGRRDQAGCGPRWWRATAARPGPSRRRTA